MSNESKISPYKGHEIQVLYIGNRRYLMIDRVKYSLSSMDIPELAAHKLIDGDGLSSSNARIRSNPIA